MEKEVMSCKSLNVFFLFQKKIVRTIYFEPADLPDRQILLFKAELHFKKCVQKYILNYFFFHIFLWWRLRAVSMCTWWPLGTSQTRYSINLALRVAKSLSTGKTYASMLGSYFLFCYILVKSKVLLYSFYLTNIKKYYIK